MKHEVFKVGFLKRIILPAFIATVLVILFIVEKDIPRMFLILFIIPIGIASHEHRTKLIIENDRLTYQSGMFFTKNQDVSLKNVSQIIMRQIVTVEEDSDGNQKRVRRKIIYVLDEEERTYFSFPADLIKGKNKRRFDEAVISVNPKITM